MKKIKFLLVVFILVVLSGACSPRISSSKDAGEAPGEIQVVNSGENPSTNVSSFFREELERAGVERVGQPIEGFNAFIYLEAFPGFEESDFDGVKTLEGIYKVEDGSLQFERTTGNPITSAEEMISEEGYLRLLQNFSERVGVEIASESDIATLLEKLREGDVDQNSYITSDFSIWLPDSWYPYDLGYSVLFVHDPDLDIEDIGATEGFALAPYIQVVKQEIDVELLFEENLWTDDSEFLVSKDDVRIGNDERIRVVTIAAGASGNVLHYVFDAEDSRVFTLSIYPYEPGSPDTDDFERIVQSFMINYEFDSSENGN